MPIDIKNFMGLIKALMPKTVMSVVCVSTAQTKAAAKFIRPYQKSNGLRLFRLIMNCMIKRIL